MYIIYNVYFAGDARKKLCLQSCKANDWVN